MTLAEQLIAGAKMAHESFPRLTPYAPTVQAETLPPNLSHVAGRYDADLRSVLINAGASQQLNPQQLSGLIGLERARGFLSSPLGRQFTDSFPLPQNQRDWWDKFYLPPTVNAPQDDASRASILKSTMLSRLLVGDTMPQGAPPLTPEQEHIGSLFGTYASMK